MKHKRLAGGMVAGVLLAGSVFAGEREIRIDLSKIGRCFDGYGTLSAGASSRLLHDYPEPQRSEVLDYLFKPNFGAAQQILKVEIGGDGNSTDGSEPCHARTLEEYEHPKPEYFKRGYEWWLMAEARKRNPEIKLACLQWSAPSWVTMPDRRNLFTRKNADLVVSFIKGAKKYHDLDIDYCGMWNESEPGKAGYGYIKTLRSALDNAGLTNVKIVACDLASGNKWKVAELMKEDAGIRNAVYAIGIHYGFGHPTPEAALKSGKPLWRSESGWGYMGRLNKAYVENRIVSDIRWATVTSFYRYLRCFDPGAMIAREPWSGNYKVKMDIWAMAHTTQFTKPGWRYVDSGCALLDGVGAYSTYLSPDKKEISIVIDSMSTKKEASDLVIHVPREFASRKFQVWTTTTSEWFVQGPGVAPENGVIKLALPPKSYVTISTTTGQHRGSFENPPPESAPFPFPYADDFESYEANATPRYFSDDEGAFEVKARKDGKGKCLRQVVPAMPIQWGEKRENPQTFIGEAEFTNFTASVDFKLVAGANGFVVLAGRMSSIVRPNHLIGVKALVKSDGSWVLTDETLERTSETVDGKRKNHTKFDLKQLLSGHAELKPGWNSLALGFDGSRVELILNGHRLGNAECRAKKGAVALGCDYQPVEFDNLKIGIREKQ
jgi:galactosylceramidase